MGFDYLKKQSDSLLTKLVVNLMEKGEIEWFESKRSYGDLKEVPTLLSSISNNGGGLIFYGWDEVKKDFYNIDPDKLERIINQKSNLCHPKIIVKYHIIKNNKNLGLFVGVPAMDNPVMDDKKKYYLRVGSHKKEVSRKVVLESIHNRKKQKGHLYVENFKHSLFDVAKKKFCDEIDQYVDSLSSFCDELYYEILNNFVIDFETWLGDSTQNFPIRVRFKKWKKSIEKDSYNDLAVNILKWIDEIYELLVLLEEKYNVDSIKELLKDLSHKENGETHHRRCLTTLLNQEKMWNFTDARIFVKKEENNLVIYQDEAGKDLAINIGNIDTLDMSKVEEIISVHNRKKCSDKAKQLIDAIYLELQKMKNTLCS